MTQGSPESVRDNPGLEDAIPSGLSCAAQDSEYANFSFRCLSFLLLNFFKVLARGHSRRCPARQFDGFLQRLLRLVQFAALELNPAKCVEVIGILGRSF